MQQWKRDNPSNYLMLENYTEKRLMTHDSMAVPRIFKILYSNLNHLHFDLKILIMYVY